jgi:hypothetical protein
VSRQEEAIDAYLILLGKPGMKDRERSKIIIYKSIIEKCVF